MLKENERRKYMNHHGGNTIMKDWGSDLSERKLINKNEIN